MPVLEVTQLRLNKLRADDPTLLKNLSTVRDKLQTSSQFYSCIQDPTLLYILGIWPSLAAHQEFLASPAREEILGPQEEMLQFQWTVHMELDGMSSLPLDAPILAIERFSVDGSAVEAFEQAAMRHAQHGKGNHSFKVAHGWQCDATVGSHEALVFSGWESTQAHVPFATRQEGSAAVEEGCRSILVHHAWNVERQSA
ncbi:hypothetical protein P153DRAFT_368588 [Dothidotthia symphoricarpi CBS 119687]|uniref:ABM domain-containing protein n=1 Tax=Dothidotthia symphoricarpi CBS 119687 TaxID=1392245 RepID=A0A6A6A6V3_9PLEO|nr:uncharacterized protein P153DRAFT_368588 [Dothidotthia symphoricarpi CBS 119687]KAF2127276.1 hypothetical protein P153DRAFT_368588 [Dothidotthia symphoricarpi CBS 119687]